jgi:hypothetical protein
VNRCTCPLASDSRLPVPRRSLRGASLFAVASVLGWDAGGASAQVLDPCLPAPSVMLAQALFQVLSTQTSCPLATGHQDAGKPPLSPARALLYSALLPGLGQRKLGRGRWIAYVAVEGAAWIAFGAKRWSATRERGQYRDLAWETARSFNGSRVNGGFPYFETMGKFLASGPFDTDLSAPGIQPEMDPSTFNGQAWVLATEIHFPPGVNPVPGDPAYEAALVDYQDRAYDERFEWSWAGQPAALADYKELIDSSDASFRRASQFLGVVIANHLLSAVDAFVTARIQESGSRTAVQIRPLPPDDRNRLGLVLQVRH